MSFGGWRIVASMALAATLTTERTALADGTAPDAKAMALDLFLQGRELMDKKEYERACPKFEESQRLDPGGGTLLNLAQCHEMIGRTATAWVEFSDALRIASLDGRDDRVEFARQHIDALAPRLSRLRVVVTPDARVPGLVVRRDGVELREAVWGELVPVDPGEHVVEAVAPGKRAARISVHVENERDEKTVTIEPLADEPAETVVAPAPARPSATEEVQRSAPVPTMRVVGVVTAVAGVLSIGAGGYFGLRALDEGSMAADAGCPSPATCTLEAEAHNNEAKAAADLSTAFFAVGIAAVAVGSILYFTAPRGHRQALVRDAILRW